MQFSTDSANIVMCADKPRIVSSSGGWMWGCGGGFNMGIHM